MQSTKYSAEDEQELMARLWSPAIKDNPLAFVMYAFPWGSKGTPLEHFQGRGVLRYRYRWCGHRKGCRSAHH